MSSPPSSCILFKIHNILSGVLYFCTWVTIRDYTLVLLLGLKGIYASSRVVFWAGTFTWILNLSAFTAKLKVSYTFK